ncbi:MAG: cyclic nucleotide-binding domain-containing protein [Blastochloris sp.]|nr:cyclic nucleotide-binding domain-containing protein [Blastochloris sp.]
MSLFSYREDELSAELTLLREVPLFSTLKRRDLRVLEPILHERSYVHDEVIFEEGDEGLGMYVVLEGQVRIARKGLIGSKEVTRLGPGQFFGELSLLDGGPRSASAVATDSCRLFGFFRPEFLEILEKHEKIGAKISFQLAKLTTMRLRQSIQGAQINGSL